MMTPMIASAEGHQDLQVDFNQMIEDSNRDSKSLHEQIDREIQDVETARQTDSKDNPIKTGTKQYEKAEATQPGVG